MASTLEKLIAGLSIAKPYEGLTDEQIRRQADQRYQETYDQLRLSARQAYEAGDAALERELSALQGSYDAQRAKAAQETKTAYESANHQALSRGMQRSSYNNATLANIDLAGDAALLGISQEQAGKESDIAQQRTLLSRQLADQLKQYDESQQSDALAYADELAAREYDRKTASVQSFNQLAMQLYEYQHELEKEAEEHARWKAEFNAKYGQTSSRGGSSSGRSGAKISTKSGNTAAGILR